MSVLDGWWQASSRQGVQSDPATQAKIMQLITATLGLQVRPQDEAAIAHKLKVRSQSLGLAHLRDYYTLLLASDTSQRQSQEWCWLIECLTTTESYFFRDKGQFSLLRHQILPELIARKRQTASLQTTGRPCLRLWSAGCSSGEEAYSLAILVRELIPDLGQWDVTILGTDMNRAVLTQARSGIYSNWSFRALDPAIQQQYFQPHRDGWQIRADIRPMVTFQVSNLVQDVYPDCTRLLDQIDLIVCRNVFIYFEPKTIAQVLKKFYVTLQPQGYLLVGHTELQGIDLSNFQVCSFPASVIYQRPNEVYTVRNPIVETVECNRDAGKTEIRSDSLPSNSSHPSVNHARPAMVPSYPVPSGTPLPLLPSAQALPSSSVRVPTPALLGSSTTPVANLDDLHSRLLQQNNMQAIQHLQHLLQSDPKNIAAHHLLAQVYANSGQHEQAIATCQQAMHVDPLSVDPCYLLAQIREEQGDLEAAKNLYKRIIYMMPDSIHAYLQLAELYAREGNQKKALSTWQSALDLVQRSPQLAQSFAHENIDIADLERHLKTQLGL